MLKTCVPHPDIYDNNLINNKFYCECLCNALDKILINGIIFTDNNNRYIELINKYIEKWPNNDKSDKLKRKLKLLFDYGKIVKIDTNVERLELGCVKENCKIFHSLLQNSETSSIVPEWCDETNESNIRYTKLSEFTESKLYDELDKRSEFYDKGDESKFEEEVLIPFLKYCKSVKIIDRVFSDHINEKTNYDIKKEYKNGLENIIKIIKSNNINASKVNVELYIAFKYDSSNKFHIMSVKQKILKINEFINSLEKKYEINIECYYKENYFDLTHERYIITNQAGIEIGRGLDFKDSKGKLRDINVSLLSREQKRKLENRIRIADDFYDIAN
ncbi:hypothetical protein ACV3P1_04030 [Clostridium perfringens]|uniref:hypothetical protein n=1 Tax=Clostridium perfringens TaxID=1502 RepID=UPI00224614E8|nr:hypothetical protein [Clostridium perfringens]MCX0414541.1 hypothetical protein [Clostridium perfringens]